MKSLLRRYCVILALLIYWLPSAQAQTPPRVQQIEIRHVGPPAVSDELIRANIRVKAGDPYSRTSIDDDVRNLYGTGFFYNIRVAEEPAATGLKLIYVVQGKPVLTDIQFSGNKKLSTSKLKKKVTSKTGDPIDERKLFMDTVEMKKLYQKSGYQKTDVKYVLNINEQTGRGAVTFEINETPKVKIESVEFVGAEAFPEKKLRKVIKTRERWFMSWLTGSGVLKDEQFEDDKEKLAEFYRNEGYIDFEIKDIQFDYTSEKWMVIRFVISEGRQYRVGDVKIEGPKLFPVEEIRDGLKMGVGEVFTPRGLAKDIESIQDYYGSKGYIDARVIAVKSPNTATGTMDLVYKIEENNLSYIEKIDIKGNDKTKDKVIRRELSVAPGEVFDMVNVKLSRRRLEGLNYFEKVDTQVEPTDVPNRKNLVIGVDEKNTGSLTFGAGFSSVDSIVGFAELTQGNFDLFKPPTFTGGGQKFRLRAQLGTQRQDYQMSFVEPWFLNRKLAFGVDLYHRELSFLSDLYDQRQTGARLSLTRALWSDFLIGSVSYTIENIEIKNVSAGAPFPITQEAGSRLVSKIGTSIAYDTRNSTQLPDAGQRTEFLTEFAGGPLGADTDFYKLELRSSWYFKGFFEGHVLELSGRAGVVENFDDTPRVPLFDRWFLGGLYSLRGYKFRDVGPKAGGEPIGGNTYWFGSAEYSIPIIERLRFAVFYDIGMVYQDAYSFSTKGFDTGSYNDNWGVGIRLNLPIGPLRLDYGVPIRSDDANDSSGRFQFGVGYTREF